MEVRRNCAGFSTASSGLQSSLPPGFPSEPATDRPPPTRAPEKRWRDGARLLEPQLRSTVVARRAVSRTERCSCSSHLEAFCCSAGSWCLENVSKACTTSSIGGFSMSLASANVVRYKLTFDLKDFTDKNGLIYGARPLTSTALPRIVRSALGVRSLRRTFPG